MIYKAIVKKIIDLNFEIFAIKIVASLILETANIYGDNI